MINARSTDYIDGVTTFWTTIDGQDYGVQHRNMGVVGVVNPDGEGLDISLIPPIDRLILSRLMGEINAGIYPL